MKINIRKWEKEDAQALAKIADNKKVQKNLRDGLPYPYTKKDAKDYIEFMLQADSNKDFHFAIVAEGNVVGSIGAFRQGNIHHLTAEIGYFIEESNWGKGIGTQAVKQVCEYLFQNTDIIRVFAEPFSTNIGSCRVLEKSGFVYEGTLRKNVVKNEEILDMRLYARLKE